MVGNTNQQISTDFVNYIGPFAPRLVDHYFPESSDRETFLYNLASEIPYQMSREQCIKKREAAQ